jgi:hypothetical protein
MNIALICLDPVLDMSQLLLIGAFNQDVTKKMVGLKRQARFEALVHPVANYSYTVLKCCLDTPWVHEESRLLSPNTGTYWDYI